MSLFIINKKNITYFFLLLIIMIIAYWLSRINYLIFHSIIEVASIVIATGIFMFTWNSKQFLKHNAYLLLGIAFLFIAGFDLLHTISYKGMNIIPGHQANYATQLWIAARFLESISLFLFLIFFNKNINLKHLILGYLALSLILFFSIFYWPVFPICFIEGSGLTHFKIISEYLICIILLGALFILIKYRKNELSDHVHQLFFKALIFFILSELAFTLYSDVYGFMNYFGHMFKIVSFYFIYEATIFIGVVKPHEALFKELSDKEKEFRALFELAAIGKAQTDPDFFKFIRVNKKFCDITGYTEAELLAMTFNDLTYPDDLENDVQKIKEVVSGQKESWQNIHRYIRKDRRIIWVKVTGSVIRNDKGIPQCTIAAIEDITELVQAEELLKKEQQQTMAKTLQIIDTQKKALQSAKRLSGIGQLATTVAHELRNPLGVIKTAIYNIKRKNSNPHLDKHIENIDKKIFESDRIINNLLNYARIKVPQFKKESIVSILEACMKNAKTQHSDKSFVFKTHFTKKHKEILLEADAFQLNEIFMNILNNAIDAMTGPKGVITINLNLSPQTIEIIFQDNGQGIASDDLTQVFDPFFTKKSKGTGLGLSICKELVHLHHGQISLASKENEGAKITITLPLSQT